MSKYARRIDANQNDIVKALRACGATVRVISQGDGIPDLLVGFGMLETALLETDCSPGSVGLRARGLHHLGPARVLGVEALLVLGHRAAHRRGADRSSAVEADPEAGGSDALLDRLREQLDELRRECDRDVVVGHYFLGESLEALGEARGRSKASMSRLHATALRRLAAHVGGRED